MTPATPSPVLPERKKFPMTVTANKPAPATVRLRLDESPTRKATLDGAWWPRTTDAMAELPALLDALGDRRGQITHVLLGTTEWDTPHPRRLASGPAAVRLGWYTAQPPGLLTVVTEFGKDRFDLLVVPPDATPDTAGTAMSAAADAGDGSRAPKLLDGIRRTGSAE